MEKTTIKSTLLEMKLAVETHEIKSPVWWLDKAVFLVALWQDLKDEKTKYEMAYKSEQVELIEQGKKISEAKIKSDVLKYTFPSLVILFLIGVSFFEISEAVKFLIFIFVVLVFLFVKNAID